MVEAIFDGMGRLLIRERNERMFLAWHVAALTRAKKLPKLEKLLSREKKPRQTMEQQIAIAQAWHAAITRRR